MFSVATLVA
jgi:hypothetical protein